MMPTLVPAILLLAVAAGPTRAQSVSIELELADGTTAQAIAAGPDDAGAGILIVHDWFGVTDFTRRTVDRFADAGYRVVAVDLYDGESAETHERAGELLGGLIAERVAATLDAGLEALSADDRAIGVLGFSAGAAPAFGASLRAGDAVEATAVIYGGGVENHDVDALRGLAGELLVATGSRDAWALDAAIALMPKLEEAGRSMELYVYPGARHAYAQKLFNGGANYDAEATRMTWVVVDDFLERHLGSS